MAQGEPLVLIPGLLCSARLYAPQIAALWPHGPIMVADHRRDAKMNGIAERILAEAPPRFALAGLSMGGYIAFAMMRVAPKRITRLALLDTSARPDTPEQTATRKTQMAMAESGKFDEIPTLSLPRFLHRDRQNDDPGPNRSANGERDGVRSLRAPAEGNHVAFGFSAAFGFDQMPEALVLVGDGDVATPPDLSREIAAGVAGAKLVVVPIRTPVHHRTAGRGECRNGRVAGMSEVGDTPGVIAPPPLIALGVVLTGVALDRVLPAYVLTVLLTFEERIALGIILIAAGCALPIAALKRFTAVGTNVDPFKPALHLHADIYAYVRNPMYVGLGLLAGGLAFALASDWTLVILVPGALLIHYGVVRREERYLEAKFGDTYRRYKDTVPRYGIPA